MLLQAVRTESDEVVDFEVADANKAACVYVDLSFDQLVGQLFSSLLAPEHAEVPRRALVKALTRGTPVVKDDYHYAGTAKGGIDALFDIRIAAVDHDSVVLTWRDVTERHRRDEVLRLTQQRYRSIAEATTDLVYRTDSEGVITWVSPSVIATLGWEPADLVGHKGTEFVAEEDLEWLVPQRESIYVKGENPERFAPQVLSARTKSGDYRRMSVILVRDVDDAGEFTGGLVVGLRDITALQDAVAQALAAQDEARQTRLSMDAAAIGMAITDPVTGRWTYANQALAEMLGYSVGSDLVGRSFADFTYPEDLPQSLKAWSELRRGELERFVQRKRYRTASGGSIWVDLMVTPVQDAQGVLQHFVAQLVDVSGEMAALESLRKSAGHFKLLAENASDVVYQTDVDGVIRWISPAVRDLLGWDPDVVVGRRATSLMPPENLGLVRKSRSMVYQGIPESGVLTQFLTSSGHRRWMSVSANPLFDEAEQVTGAVVALRDVTNEQRAREELALSEQRFKMAIDAAPQGIVLTDAEGYVIDINPAATALLGIGTTHVTGSPLADYLDPAGRSPCSAEGRHEHIRDLAEGGRVWFDHATSELRGAEGKLRYVVHQFIDQSANRQLQLELAHRAAHDPLTGVLNRRSLLDHLSRLHRERQHLRSGDEPLGILFCDVDRLKHVNDTLGHGAGDRVLINVADRIARAVRRGDQVGRYGGDEFVVVLDGIGSDEALAAVAEKLRSQVSQEISVNGTEVQAGISIGAALIRTGEKPEDAIMRADMALYTAKHDGRGRVVVAED